MSAEIVALLVLLGGVVAAVVFTLVFVVVVDRSLANTRSGNEEERKDEDRESEKSQCKGGVMYRLNEEQTAVIEEVRRVSDELIAPHAADIVAQGRFPREAVDVLAKAGLLGLTIPVEYGGMGHSIRVACAALDEIAQRCASTAMIYLMHLCGCSCYVARPQAVEDTLRQVARGEHLTTLAWRRDHVATSGRWQPASRRQAQHRGGCGLVATIF